MTRKMHCPLCGGVLTEVERKDPTADWDFDDPRWVTYKPNDDESIWLKCTHCNSFGDDYPLHFHHPLGDYKSRPGDSWSLSWVK